MECDYRGYRIIAIGVANRTFDRWTPNASYHPVDGPSDLSKQITGAIGGASSEKKAELTALGLAKAEIDRRNP